MSAVDRFQDVGRASSGPATRAVAVTPNDGADLAYASRAISVNGAGDVALVTLDGDTVTVTLAAGMLHPIRAKRILSTGTAATGIIAWN